MNRLGLAVALILAGCGASHKKAPDAARAPTRSEAPRAPEPESGIPSSVDLPEAKNAVPFEDEPMPSVWVTGSKIYRDGVLIAETGKILSEGRLQRVDALFDMMKTIREIFKAQNPGTPVPKKAIFAFDKTTPGVVVKSVFQTCAFAGFSSGRFAVRMSNGKIGRLDVSAIVPGPPNPGPDAPEPPDEPTLLVGLRSSKYVVTWRKAAEDLSSVEASSVADLPKFIREGWTKYSAHHDKTDGGSDQAFVFLRNEINYAGLIAVLDAVALTTRKVAFGIASEIPTGNASRMSAMVGRLAPEVIQRVIRDSYKQLRACYEKGLARNPTLTGRVQVRFTIQMDGTVAKVTEENSTLPDPDVIHCVLPEYEKLRFPKPDGGVVTVVYPIMFSPEEN